MIRKLVSLVFCFLYVFSRGQDKVETIQLDKNNEILNTVFLGENGLILKTGKDKLNTRNLDWQIHSYNSDLSLRWSVPIEKTQFAKGFSDDFLVSPSGNVVFHIEPKGYNTTFGAKKFHITYINSEGKVSGRELDNVDKYGYIQTTFCDDDNLYILSTLKGHEDHSKKMGTEKLELRIIKGKNFAIKKIKLMLPAIKDAEHNTFWYYRAHDKDGIYLVSKMIDIENKDYKITMVKVDWRGKVVSTVYIDFFLKGLSVVPSHNIKNMEGAETYRLNNDFIIKTSTGTLGNDMIINSYGVPALGSYGDIQIDLKNQCVYVYGLTGSQSEGDGETNVNRFFVNKYDMNGGLKWSVKKKEPAPLELEVKGELINYTKVALLPQPDKGLILGIYFDEVIYSYKFNAEGKLLDSGSEELDDGVNFRRATMVLDSESRLFYNSLDKDRREDHYFEAHFTKDYEILIEEDDDEDIIKLVRFDKN